MEETTMKTPKHPINDQMKEMNDQIKEHLEYLRQMDIQARWRTLKTSVLCLIPVIILGLGFGFLIRHLDKKESEAFNKLTGANTSWKDTRYVDLVVIGHPIGSQCTCLKLKNP